MKTLNLILFLSISSFIACSNDDSSEVTTSNDKGIKTEVTNTDQEKLLELVNKYRKNGCQCGDNYFGPTTPVTWNNLLENAALLHSEDMSKNSNLSHTGSNGSSPSIRITNAGYTWATNGENIARGYNTVEAVIEGWIKSPGHCKNIMNPNFAEMGVAKSGAYWTQLFARKR